MAFLLHCEAGGAKTTRADVPNDSVVIKVGQGLYVSFTANEDIA